MEREMGGQREMGGPQGEGDLEERRERGGASTCAGGATRGRGTEPERQRVLSLEG